MTLADFSPFARHRTILAHTGAVQHIIFPNLGELRSRKIVTRSRHRPVGKYPSWKNSQMLEWESVGELNAFRLLDANPTVVRFSDQPCRIVYLQDGAIRTHIPDILVEFADRKEFWEVKLKAEAATPEIATRTALMRDLRHWGYGYQVVLSEDVAVQPRLRNVAQMHYWGAVRPIGDLEREFIRSEVGQRRELTWGDACQGIFGQYGREILCRLTLEGTLTFDMTRHWTDESTFAAVKEAW